MIKEVNFDVYVDENVVARLDILGINRSETIREAFKMLMRVRNEKIEFVAGKPIVRSGNERRIWVCMTKEMRNAVKIQAILEESTIKGLLAYAAENFNEMREAIKKHDKIGVRVY